MSFARDGYTILPKDDRAMAWVTAANNALQAVDLKADRHGGTWCVGVDALPNAPDGSVGGVALRGAWEPLIAPPAQWHRAQVSVVHPGYPGQDADENDAAHRYRLKRDAAHVDGLLPEGPQRRRHLREPHAFILGLPLSDVTDSPLVVWRGSHRVMQAAFAQMYQGVPPAQMGDTDITDAYQAARKRVFDTCDRVELPAKAGEATLLHRHVLHGVAPWGTGRTPRPVAYFRPVTTPLEWLSRDS